MPAFRGRFHALKKKKQTFLKLWLLKAQLKLGQLRRQTATIPLPPQLTLLSPKTFALVCLKHTAFSNHMAGDTEPSRGSSEPAGLVASPLAALPRRPRCWAPLPRARRPELGAGGLGLTAERLPAGGVVSTPAVRRVRTPPASQVVRHLQLKGTLELTSPAGFLCS